MTDEKLAELAQQIHMAFETSEGSASENRAWAALTTLVDDDKRQRTENAALRRIAQTVVDKFNPPFTCDPCPWCSADQDYEPHAPDCIITELRTLTGAQNETPPS